jgi:polyferredoxin
VGKIYIFLGIFLGFLETKLYALNFFHGEPVLGYLTPPSLDEAIGS